MTQLITSVFRNDLAALQAALAEGANPNEKDSDARTPLIQAVIDNKQEAAKLLLASRANVDEQDKLGYTALHYAAQNYCPEMVSLLLHHSATVDVEDFHGNTALWRAVFGSQGRGEIIKALLDAGADRNHRNKHGKTPIDLSRTIGNYNVSQFFD